MSTTSSFVLIKLGKLFIQQSGKAPSGRGGFWEGSIINNSFLSGKTILYCRNTSWHILAATDFLGFLYLCGRYVRVTLVYSGIIFVIYYFLM